MSWHASSPAFAHEWSGLTIERAFGTLAPTAGKGARVTRHDAERRQKILDYIAAMIRANGVPPSVRSATRTVACPGL